MQRIADGYSDAVLHPFINFVMMIALLLMLLNAMRYARDSSVANFGQGVMLISSLLTIVYGMTCFGHIKMAGRTSTAGIVRQRDHMYKSQAACFQLVPEEGPARFLCVEEAPLFLQDGNFVRAQFVAGSDTVTELSNGRNDVVCVRSDGTGASVVIVCLGLAFFLQAIFGGLPKRTRAAYGWFSA